ncbi:T9SS type A sorting domain-containing protein [Reichenbachiella sp.]
MKSIKRISVITLLICLISMTNAQAQIELVKDINTSSETEELRINESLIIVNGKLLINYDEHPVYGSELWTLNEFNEPVIMKDINLGTQSSWPENITLFGNKVIFTAQWPGTGYAPTITDGTEEGTFLLKDFGTNSETRYFTPFGENQCLFLESGDNRLWKTDGTVAGTSIIATLPSDANNVRNFTSLGNQVFFMASLDETGQELWVTDGTDEGTKMVVDIIEGASGSGPSNLFAFNNKMYFSAYTAANGRELWVSDGTAEGTEMVADILPGSQDGLSTSYFYPAAFNGKFYFAASGTSGDIELWSSDGTTEGTSLIKNIRTASSSSPRNFFPFGDLLLFTATNDTDGQELWKTDGTEEGTLQVKDIKTDGSAYPSRFCLFNGLVYFSASETNQYDLWVTDGTEVGTSKVKVTESGTSSSLRNLVTDGTTLYYATQSDGPKLYKSDGTTEGTSSISNEATIFNDSEPRDFTSLGGDIVFTAKRSTGETSLWYIDGTTTTELLPASASTYSGANSSFEQMLIGNKLLFLATTDTQGEELWVTDGTPEGTQILKDINPDAEDSDIEDFVRFGDVVIFQADDGSTGKEPWKTDGTAEGTVLIKDIRSGSPESNPRNFLVLNDRCYFNAYDGSTGRELFVTDGTEEGTNQVVDLNPATDKTGAYNNEFIFKDKLVIFGSEDSDTYGYEIVISDGTAEGTDRISDINEGSGNTSIRDYAIFDNFFAFFTHVSANSSYELWKSDGTAEGTSMLEDGLANYVFQGSLGDLVIYFGKDSEGQVDLLATNTTTSSTTTLVADIPIAIGGEGDLNDSNYVKINGQIFLIDGMFEDEEGEPNVAAGTALWVTDGTVGGTLEISTDAFGNDIAPVNIFLIDEEVYFIGYNNGSLAYSIYHTDGTTCGTQPLNDESVEILGELVPIDGYLYFRGSTPTLGSELYRYHLNTETPNQLMAWYLDADGDGLGDENEMVEDCNQPTGYVANADDCDDNDANNACDNLLQIDASPKIVIYPNPTSEWLAVSDFSDGSVQLSLMDIDGRVVLRQQVAPRERISVANLRSGLYLLQLNQKDITTTTKILIH